MDAAPMLCQAEILALQFREIIAVNDKRVAEARRLEAPVPSDAVIDESLRALLD